MSEYSVCKIEIGSVEEIVWSNEATKEKTIQSIERKGNG